MFSASSYCKHVESTLEEKKLHQEASSLFLERLKKHSSTRVMNESPKIKEIVDFVYEETNYDPVLECSIYSITNKGIEYTIEKLEKEAESFDRKKRGIYKSIIHSYKAGQAFYVLDTQEVFYITDIAERKDIRKARKKNPSKYKPSRFSDDQWRLIQIRASLVHELFHFHMDRTSYTRNEMLQEHYAYSNMIGWCREREGLDDKEIAKYVINTYGVRLAYGENPGLDPENEDDQKFLDEKGFEEGMKLIQQYDAERSGDNNLIEEDSEQDQEQEEFDPFGLF